MVTVTIVFIVVVAVVVVIVFISFSSLFGVTGDTVLSQRGEIRHLISKAICLPLKPQ